MTVASQQVAQALAQASEQELVPLPQLLNPSDYRPDALLHTYRPRAILQASGLPTYPALEDWVEIFRHSISSFRKTAEADASLPELERRQYAAAFAESYARTLEEVEAEAVAAAAAAPSAPPLLGCMELCRLREEALLSAGFTDIFEGIKARENAQALALLPEVCAEIDNVADPAQRWEMVLRGVFAGNIFDLGTAATTSMYHEQGGVSFHDTRERLLPRPWAIDCMDELVAALAADAPGASGSCSGDGVSGSGTVSDGAGPAAEAQQQERRRHRLAVLFVDNSGADVVLGMLPLARELIRQGTAVILAANARPSINDITFAELDRLLPAIGAADPALCKAIATRQLRVMSSGSGLPVIDLSRVSRELAEAAVGADLVVLEGMGRSIETNLRCWLSSDVMRLGMIKHPEVATALGGHMFDVVCSFTPAPRPPAC